MHRRSQACYVYNTWNTGTFCQLRTFMFVRCSAHQCYYSSYVSELINIHLLCYILLLNMKKLKTKTTNVKQEKKNTCLKKCTKCFVTLQITESLPTRCVVHASPDEIHHHLALSQHLMFEKLTRMSFMFLLHKCKLEHVSMCIYYQHGRKRLEP